MYANEILLLSQASPQPNAFLAAAHANAGRGRRSVYRERERRRGVTARMCLSDSSHLLFTYKCLIWRRKRSRERRCEKKTQLDVVQRLLLPEGGAVLPRTEARHVTGSRRSDLNSDQYNDNID